MATLAELNVRIAANIDDFERAMEQAERGVGRLGDRLQSAGRALSIGITVPLGLLAGAAINAYGKLESLGKGLDAIARQELSDKGVTGIAAIGQAATQTSARLKELEQLAKAPGIGFEQAVKGDIRLRAVGFTAEQSAAALREFANAIATTGGSASDLDGVTVQLAQLSAKGKVLAQDLRPIIERAPILASVLKKLYNTVDSETISKSLEKQGKNSQDFINEITVQLGKLPRVTGGIANQFENLGQTATQSLAKLGESFSKAINLPAIVEGISNGIERLTAAFTSLSPGTQKLIFGLAGAAAAVGPVLLAVGTLGAALPAITAGFSVLGITSVAALGPIGLAAAGVAAAAFLIIDHWDELVAYFGPLGEGGRLFSDLSDSISQSAGEIGNALASINTGGDNFGDLISATGIFKDLFSSLTVGITAFSDYFGGVIGTVTRLLQGDLTGAAEQATRVLYGLIDPIANLLGFTKKAAAGGGDGLGYFGDQALRAASGLGFLNQQLTGFAGGLPQQDKVVFAQIGLLEELRAKLKAVKEQRETETSTAAIAADNKLVDSYQKQIDALLGVEKRTRKQKDALAELRKELANVDTYAKIFSTPAEGAQIAAQKIDVLKSGIQSLIKEGYNPLGRVVQEFAQQRLKLEQGLNAIDLPEITPILSLPGADAIQTYGGRLKQVLGKQLASTFSDDVRGLSIFVPLSLKLMKTDFSTEIANAGLEVQKAFRENNALDLTFGNLKFGDGFNKAAADAAALTAQLKKLLSEGVSPLDPAFKQLSAGLDSLQLGAKIKEGLDSLNSAVNDGLAQLTGSIGRGLGAALAGTDSLGDALSKSLLAAAGGVAVQLGELAIGIGFGLIGIKKAFESLNGYVAIAAGVALIALGTYASEKTKGIGKGIGSGGAGGSLSSVPSTNYSISATQRMQPLVITVHGELTGNGDVLRGIIREGEYRQEIGG